MIIKMKKIALLTTIVSFLFSCDSNQDSPKNSITGNISNLDENTKIYFDYITLYLYFDILFWNSGTGYI